MPIFSSPTKNAWDKVGGFSRHYYEETCGFGDILYDYIEQSFRMIENEPTQYVYDSHGNWIEEKKKNLKRIIVYSSQQKMTGEVFLAKEAERIRLEEEARKKEEERIRLEEEKARIGDVKVMPILDI